MGILRHGLPPRQGPSSGIQESFCQRPASSHKLPGPLPPSYQFLLGQSSLTRKTRCFPQGGQRSSFRQPEKYNILDLWDRLCWKPPLGSRGVALERNSPVRRRALLWLHSQKGIQERQGALPLPWNYPFHQRPRPEKLHHLPGGSQNMAQCLS